MLKDSDLQNDERTKEKSTLARTDWAEYHLEEFLSLPLISEFVFRSPQKDLGKKRREVADFLVLLGNSGILISQKCQDNPSGRDSNKTTLWARKEGKRAVSQLLGALRTVNHKAIWWCNHPRRGRVDFPDGLPRIVHGIVLLEVHEPISLEQEADELPLDFKGTPISYLSVNDFMNLAVQLRTMPEILAYLEAKRSLPAADLRHIGDEKSLFQYYFLNDGSLRNSSSRADARTKTISQHTQIEKALRVKAQSDRYSMLIERVADLLSTRNPDYAHGLSEAMLARFDSPANRLNYLEMQSVIANLRLFERVTLGQELAGLIDSLKSEAEGFIYTSICPESKPDWVFVLGSAKKQYRPLLLEQACKLLAGALAFYKKEHAMIIVDTDRENSEVALCHKQHPTPPEQELQDGINLFGHLKTREWIIPTLYPYSPVGTPAI